MILIPHLTTRADTHLAFAFTVPKELLQYPNKGLSLILIPAPPNTLVPIGGVD